MISISKEELEDFLNDEILLTSIDCKRANNLFVDALVGIGRLTVINRIEKKFGLKLNWPNNRWEPNNFDFENLVKE